MQEMGKVEGAKLKLRRLFIMETKMPLEKAIVVPRAFHAHQR